MTAIKNPSTLLTRYIAIKLILDEGVFPSTSTNERIIFANSTPNNFTTEITINKTTGFTQCSADITIYGLNKADCNAFSRFNVQGTFQLFKNHVEIYAGYTVDAKGLPPLAFNGQVFKAGADFNNASRPFKIEAIMGVINQNTPALATNPEGTIPLDALFKSIVAKDPSGKYVYQGNLVKGTTSNVVYTGSWMKQLQDACEHYGYQTRLDGNKVYVTPIGQNYLNTNYVLNSDNGMLGYPIIDDFGVIARMRFNPSIQFGQRLQIENSEQELANDGWFINGLVHTLHNRGPKFETTLMLNSVPYNLPGLN